MWRPKTPHVTGYDRTKRIVRSNLIEWPIIHKQYLSEYIPTSIRDGMQWWWKTNKDLFGTCFGHLFPVTIRKKTENLTILISIQVLSALPSLWSLRLNQLQLIILSHYFSITWLEITLHFHGIWNKNHIGWRETCQGLKLWTRTLSIT